MARLRLSSGGLVPIASHGLIGRSRRCTIRLIDPEVSSEHALLRWCGSWELQDLHSRNGTFVRGTRLAPGQRVELAEGDVFGCGRVEGLELVDASPPLAFARHLADNTIVEAEGGLLVLPGGDAPERTIYEQGEKWRSECSESGGIEVVEDGALIETAGGLWQLALPRSLPRTADVGDPVLTVASLRLVFAVSRDEEQVELCARARGRRLEFKARAHHYTLLLLARARLADHDHPPEEQGWVYQDDFLRQLRSEPGTLYVEIHRLRRQFAAAGVCDAVHIVERRRERRQIRIGAAHLEVRSLDS